jgi:competence protein ComEA
MEVAMYRTCVGVLVLLLVGLLAGPVMTAQQPAADAGKAAVQPSVNLNTATVAQLETLPGVGPAMAARIIEHRQKNGPFKKVEELMNVKGIGEKNFLKLKPLVTVTPPKS